MSVPEYTVESKPDYLAVGATVDRAVENGFPDGAYVARALGLVDHPGLDLDALAAIVERTGTDKYSPGKPPVGDFGDYDFDFHGSRFVIQGGRVLPDPGDTVASFFGDIAFHFCEHAPIDRGYPVRIDLLLVYDETQLQRGTKKAAHLPGVLPRFERHLYKFANRAQPGDALIGLVKILR